MKLPKFNQKGITHLLAPIAFILIFAAIGGIVLLKSHAASAISCYITGPKTARWGQAVNEKMHIVNGSSSPFTPHETLNLTRYTVKQVASQQTFGPAKEPTIAPNTTATPLVWKLIFKKPYTKEVMVFGDSKESFTCHRTVTHITD